LAFGWLQSAMLNGTLPYVNGASGPGCPIGPPQLLSIGVGTWTPQGNITFNTVHNSHIHIGLTF
jgi:hypothetical protein